MMRSKRGALLLAASLNLSSKVLSSFSINAVGKLILFNAGQYTHQKNIEPNGREIPQEGFLRNKFHNDFQVNKSHKNLVFKLQFIFLRIILDIRILLSKTNSQVMASKKYILLAGIICLLATGSFAQVGASYDLKDSSLIPSKRMPQHSEFLNGTYNFPAKPRNQWEIGLRSERLP
jgi:hypothetical protein